MKEAGRWHALIPGPITTSQEALAFLNACGFCTWGPVPRLSFPNLAEAMGETATSVLDRTWSWKDDLHFAQQLYYGKMIAGQPSFLAPDYLPDYISALAGRGRERERDVTRLYFDGRLSGEAKAIYDWLRDHPAHRRGNSDAAPGWARRQFALSCYYLAHGCFPREAANFNLMNYALLHVERKGT